MKMKSVSSSLVMSCVLLISAAVTFFSVGEKGKGGKYPTKIRSKSDFETSSLCPR